MRFFFWGFIALIVAASVATLLQWYEAYAEISRQIMGTATPTPYVVPRSYHASAPMVRSNALPCSLVATKVTAQVTGYTARVMVKQVFRNPNSKKFDAIYTFPLGNTAAVERMTVRIGGRTIEGSIRKTAEARLFSPCIANVQPGEKIEITLQYTDVLSYANGKYLFVYPTKISPRFVPLGARNSVRTSNSGGRLAFDININGGMPIYDVLANVGLPNAVSRPTNSMAHFSSQNIPVGDDFKLSWSVAGDGIQSGIFTQLEGDRGYLTVMVMPPKRVAPSDVAPKEFVFLIDCSGSQAGMPLQKAKETLHYIVDHMGERDTFQIVAFSHPYSQFAPEPRSVSAQMKMQAHAWIDRLEANGGTMVAPVVERICAMPAPENRLRIVSFMTDGFISNDYAAINLVKRLRGNSRWFPFATGNGVNHSMIDGIAKEGGGEPEYVAFDKDGSAVAQEFFARFSSPVLTDLKIRFEGISAIEIYPKVISDVWAEKPLYFHARYSGSGTGFAVISGFAAGHPYEMRLPIELPRQNEGSATIGQAWARAKIDDLMSQDLVGMHRGASDAWVKQQITAVALQHHLLSNYTSLLVADHVSASTVPASKD